MASYPTVRCPGCGRHLFTATPPPLCDDCVRHAAIGKIVSEIVSEWQVTGHWRILAGGLDLLDAVAVLLGQVSRCRRAAMEEALTEQRAVNRALREAHDDGYRAGRRESQGEWE